MIQIDMEMPKSCDECRFCIRVGTCNFFCRADREGMCVNKDVWYGKRSKYCILKEVKQYGKIKTLPVYNRRK